MLRCYSLLARDAQTQRVKRWQLKPKHHHLWHGFRHARISLRNPKHFWLFKHEDFVGRMTRIGRLVHPSSLSRRVLQAWSVEVAMQVAPERNTELTKRKVQSKRALALKFSRYKRRRLPE